MMQEFRGLTSKEVLESRNQYGSNEMVLKKKGTFLITLKYILMEPIYLLLSGVAIIYFILGENSDGLVMIAFVLFVIGIDVLQGIRTGNVLKKLKDYSKPKVTVIRNGSKEEIEGRELVVGDVLYITEGMKLPADGWVLQTQGLCIDESILTGEADGVWKEAVQDLEQGYPSCEDDQNVEETEGDNRQEFLFRKDYCYTGTLVLLGSGLLLADKIGEFTEYAKIAESLQKIERKNSPLQIHLSRLAGWMTKIAILVFGIVVLINLVYRSGLSWGERLTGSLLAGMALTISIIPAEIPVIQSVFLSMGALRLARKNALVRSLSAVETLGSISVLCVDKTGTITKNQMEVADAWAAGSSKEELCRAILLSSREFSFDSMEQALLKYCSQKYNTREACLEACSRWYQGSTMQSVKEYPFTNEGKAMGLVWDTGNLRILAVKGSFETVLPLCNIDLQQQKRIQSKISEYASRGLRVIAVGEQIFTEEEELPPSLIDCRMIFKGLVGLEDPPREGVEEQIEACYRAGIRVLMITGDHQDTALSIASRIGIRETEFAITGSAISKMSDDELRETVKKCTIYSRVLPIHKMRIIKALKENGEVTAMTGDGVNDSPALKSADIGVAMGKHGAEISREAADLILLDDNFQTILDSVKDGRRIHSNMTKAIGYIIAIHLPITLISIAAPLLRIPVEAWMLLPLHIVLMELIMDPTVSIALERQPAEDRIMNRPPYTPEESLLPKRVFVKSLIQGFVIFAASFFSYYTMLHSGYTPEKARTVGYGVLVLSNVFLVIINCSETESLFQILKKMKGDITILIMGMVTAAELLIIVYTPLSGIFKLHPVPFTSFMMIVCISFLSVAWYEIIKFLRRIRKTNNSTDS